MKVQKADRVLQYHDVPQLRKAFAEGPISEITSLLALLFLAGVSYEI